MVAISVDGSILEDSIGMAFGPSAHILLAQSLQLRFHGDGLELFGKGNLLELHLVHLGLGRAEQHSCGTNQSSLHRDGRETDNAST